MLLKDIYNSVDIHAANNYGKPTALLIFTCFVIISFHFVILNS